MAAQVFLLAAPKRLGGRGDFAADLDREVAAVDLDKDGIMKFAQQVSIFLDHVAELELIPPAVCSLR